MAACQTAGEARPCPEINEEDGRYLEMAFEIKQNRPSVPLHTNFKVVLTIQKCLKVFALLYSAIL